MPDDELDALRDENAELHRRVHVLEGELGRLRAENAELTHRQQLVDDELAGLRAEALQRRAEVRRLAESLPATVSRRTMLTQMTRDVLHHPDKLRMAGRGVRKLDRGVRKAAKTITPTSPPSSRSTGSSVAAGPPDAVSPDPA